MADTDFDEYHIHQCILYEFNKGSSALQTKKNICSVYTGAVTVSECQQLFKKFKKGEWDFADQTTDSEKTEDGREEKTDPPKKPMTKKSKEISKKHKTSSPNEKNLTVKKKKSKEENLLQSDNNDNNNKELSPKDSSVIHQNNKNDQK